MSAQVVKNPEPLLSYINNNDEQGIYSLIFEDEVFGHFMDANILTARRHIKETGLPLGYHPQSAQRIKNSYTRDQLNMPVYFGLQNLLDNIEIKKGKYDD